MIYRPIAIYDRDSIEERCVALIARCAPRFMLIGGGALSADHKGSQVANRLRPEQKARILELGREGKLNGTQIARACGATQSSTHKWLRKHGIAPPDGRESRLMEVARQ